MKKWCALSLALVLILSTLAGCNPTDQELLEGKWTATVDLALALEDLLAREDATVAAHIDLPEFKVKLTLRFNEDGTYRMEADREALEIGAARLEEAIRKGMSTYLQAQTGKTMDNLLAATSMTMDELMEKYFSNDLAGAIRTSLESEGTYRISGGKLSLLDQDGTKFFEGKYDVEEELLKLKSGVARALTGSLLPLTLEKK